MRYGDKIKIVNGLFKGMTGELVGVSSSSECFNGNQTTKTMALIELDEVNQVFVSVNDIEEICELPERIHINHEDVNYINLESNVGDWSKSKELYEEDEHRDVIFLEADNYSYDDDENTHYFTSLSVPQAKFLIEKLQNIVDFMEK